MAASDNVSDRILSNIDTASLTYINDTFVNLWGAISVSFRNILVLWIILYGLAIWRGLVKIPVQEFAWTMLKFLRPHQHVGCSDVMSAAAAAPPKVGSAVKNRFNRRTVAPKP